MKGGSLLILLIEDSPTDAILLTENLRRVTEFKFEIHHSKALQAGLDKLTKDSYDAVLLDLGLPDSTGAQTFERVKAQSEDVPVIVLTGNDDRSLLAEVLKKGADNYLIKDVANGNRIAVAILSAIRNRLAAHNASAMKE